MPDDRQHGQSWRPKNYRSPIARRTNRSGRFRCAHEFLDDAATAYFGIGSHGRGDGCRLPSRGGLSGPADITFTEFTNVNEICRGPDHLLSSLIYSEAERPIVAQLYNKDPEQFYRAAQVVCELGFDGLDINMGCPSKSVAASGSGAAIIKTPGSGPCHPAGRKQGLEDWAAGQSIHSQGFKPSRIEFVHELNYRRSGSPVVPRRLLPLSVKTRLGFDCVVVERWVEHLLEMRPAAITVHGRTLQQMYRGAADWTAIAGGQARPGYRDVDFRQQRSQYLSRCRATMAESRVQGVLVGRRTLGAPWFFREKNRPGAFIERLDLSALPSPCGSRRSRCVTACRSCSIMRGSEAIAGLECFPFDPETSGMVLQRLSSCGGHAWQNVRSLERGGCRTHRRGVLPGPHAGRSCRTRPCSIGNSAASLLRILTRTIDSRLHLAAPARIIDASGTAL